MEELGDSLSFYKVGMELFYAAGPEIITYLKEKNKKVFLDLKLQDIPNTVAHSLAVLTRLGVDILNVHAVGGAKMMAEGAKRCGLLRRPCIDPLPNSLPLPCLPAWMTSALCSLPAN